MSEGLTPQKKLAHCLGIPVDALRELRRQQMVSPRDYVQEGNVIQYTEAGVALAENVYGVKGVAEKTAPEAAQGPVNSRVTRNRCGFNKKIVEVEILDGPRKGDRVMVMVRSNANFAIGMEMPVLVVGPDRAEMIRRAPRFPGIW